MYQIRTKDWQLKTKQQLQMLEQDQLNTYVKKFIKKKNNVDARGYESSDNERSAEKKYIQTLEGKALHDYVERYTHKKSDNDYQKFLQDKQEAKEACRGLRNLHPKEPT